MTYPSFLRYNFKKSAFFMFYNTFFVKLFKCSDIFSYFCNDKGKTSTKGK